jgi:hypothetical protein
MTLHTINILHTYLSLPTPFCLAANNKYHKTYNGTVKKIHFSSILLLDEKYLLQKEDVIFNVAGRLY